MSRKITNWIIILLFVGGIALVFYPRISAYFSAKASNEAIKEFELTALSITGSVPGESEAEPVDEEQENEQSQKLYSDMQEYNQKIYEEGQFSLQDPFLFETPAFNLAEYGISDDVAGYLNIPKMDAELPIYLGASTANMALGAVNLGNTSTPIGGTNTNAVFAAHRGWRGTAMFRDIELLEIGDVVYITNFWETLTYQVVETKAILPTDINEVCIQEGRDLITLITCHPYTKNYQRYVVYCERIEQQTVSEVNEEEMTEAVSNLSIHYIFKLNELSESQRVIFAEKWIPIGIAIILLMIALIRIMLWINSRRERR